MICTIKSIQTKSFDVHTPTKLLWYKTHTWTFHISTGKLNHCLGATEKGDSDAHLIDTGTQWCVAAMQVCIEGTKGLESN